MPERDAGGMDPDSADVESGRMSSQPPAHAPSSRDMRIARVTRIAFWSASALFFLACVWLGSVNNQPGGWDSLANLIVARNIAEGHGFVTDFVGDYVVRHELPGPEFTRPPGVPYLIAPVYRLLGVSLSVHVWLNAVVILVSALLVRAAVRADGGDWPADLAGLVMLHVHAPLTTAWNNGPLILTTAAMLLIVVLWTHARIKGTRLAIACALVTAIGFLMKQTFLLSGGACALVLLGTSPQQEWRERFRHMVVFAILFLLLTSPYWATNIARYGEPLYAPVHRFHLQIHYGASPWYEYYRRVLIDERPLTLGEVVDRVGILNMIRSELNYTRERVAAIASPNPFLLIPAALGILLMRRSEWRKYAALAALMIGPLVDTALWVVEPRYLLPLFPCIAFLGWLAVRNYRAWARGAMQPALVSRVVAGYVVVLAGTALYAVIMGWPAAHGRIISARTPTPTWTTILRTLPEDVVVMSDEPPTVSWWVRRKAIVTPVDERRDLLTAVRMYNPTYYLDLGSIPSLTAWKAGELEPLASEPGWSLHRIRIPASVLE